MKSTMHNALLAEHTYFVDHDAFSGDATTMTGIDASTAWRGSSGVNDTGLPDAGAVYFEQAQGGGAGSIALAVRSRSGRCFYARDVEDGSLSPSGVNYFSETGTCADPWDRTSQDVHRSY